MSMMRIAPNRADNLAVLQAMWNQLPGSLGGEEMPDEARLAISEVLDMWSVALEQRIL